jgi:hypothetical protein
MGSNFKIQFQNSISKFNFKDQYQYQSSNLKIELVNYNIVFIQQSF